MTATAAAPAVALVAQNALLAFGTSSAEGAPFVEALWATPVLTGKFRYYDGMLYLFGLLHGGGHFHLEW